MSTITVSDGLWKDIETAAKTMLAAGKTLAPMTTPDGHATLHVSTDKSLLRGAFMSVEVDGIRVHAGMLA